MAPSVHAGTKVNITATKMTRRNPSVFSSNTPSTKLLRSASSPTPSAMSVLEKRKSNFVLSLCMGAFFFVFGVVVGFTVAVYDHETTDLAWGISVCLLIIVAASLRLPIVYQLIIPEPATKWRDDRSISLYIAIALVGLASGLLLPAELMLIEIIITEPSELQWERGGWVAIAALVLPVLVGIVTSFADFRQEAEEREKWMRMRRTRQRARKYGSRVGNSSDSIALVIHEGGSTIANNNEV